MYYTHYTSVKGLVDERLQRASMHRTVADDAEERDGPFGRFRHRAGHALIVAGEIVAHGGHTAAHGVQDKRPSD